MKNFTLILFFCLLNTIGTIFAEEVISTRYRNSLSLAFSPVNNKFEDENIILEIYDGKLYAKNKTDKTIFIDLSRSFLINNNSSYPLFSQYIPNEKTPSLFKYSNNEEFIAIAPATGNEQNETFITSLTPSIYGDYSSTSSPSEKFSQYDVRFLNLMEEILDESLKADPKKKNYIGTVYRHLTENESILNIGASISYAFDKKAENWNNVTITTWVSDIVFAPYYVDIPNISNKEKRGFGAKDTTPVKIHVRGSSPFEYDKDKSPIIIADWKGNFNKGIFTLKDILELHIEKNSPLVKKNHLGNLTYPKVEILYEGSEPDWGSLFHSDFKTFQYRKK